MDAAVQLDSTPGKRECLGILSLNLTRGDSRMKVRLKILPDKLRGGAWPSPVRAVKCPVKSGNEQDPCPMLLWHSVASTHRGPPSIKWRKVRSTAGPYALNPLGYTRHTMVGIMGCDSERRSQSPNPIQVRIEDCNPSS